MRLFNRLLAEVRDMLWSREDERMEDDEVDQFHSWSLTARMAALSSQSLERCPPEVAALIREAKELHPVMATGALRRDAEENASDAASASDERAFKGGFAGT